MLKKLWFQLHWIVGITAGIVLAVVGVTGGILSFEHETLRWINPGIMSVEARPGGPLAPPALLERLQANNPGRAITALSVSSDPTDAARVTLSLAGGQGQGGGRQRGETRYVDPYTADLLGQPRGQPFFRLTMQIHRWLAAGDVGKQIVGASTVLLIVLSLTGLYLRWPRKPLQWRSWFKIDMARKGRSFLWEIHSVIGGWVLIPYVIMSLSGLFWSYDWYRSGLYTITGTPRPGGPMGSAAAGPGTQRGAPPARAADSASRTPLATTEIWSLFLRESGGYSTATLRPPAGPGQPYQVTYQTPNPQHERANNTLALDPVTGEVRNHRRYSELPFGQMIMASIFALHSGGFFGIVGLILFMLASLVMPLFAITGWMLYLDRRAKKRAATAIARALGGANGAEGGILVAYASQSGTAERLAWQSAAALQSSGRPVAVEPLARLDDMRLKRTPLALFVVSTFGDGEAPDLTRRFARTVMESATQLSGLNYGLLALGDRKYSQFCGFGHDVDAWLRRQGATPLFDRVEVDNGDGAALRHWQSHLALLSGNSEFADWTPPSYGRWLLADRRLLNPGSVGWPCYHVELEPADPRAAAWRAGDIAEIGPVHAAENIAAFLASRQIDGASRVTFAGQEQTLAEALAVAVLPDAQDLRGKSTQQIAEGLKPLPHREYSIASTPSDGRVHLLVRQMRRPDGTPGLGSGWLTGHAEMGSVIALRLRSNPGFHGPDGDRPMILIGNGTGLGGLRAHLRERARLGHRRNWLIFGERNAAHDFFYRNEIESWQDQGVLQRVDLAFSRDQEDRIYVQHRLTAARDELLAWVEAGAAIYVCGSLEGMAPAVHDTLQGCLGVARLKELAESGFYRRDVY